MDLMTEHTSAGRRLEVPPKPILVAARTTDIVLRAVHILECRLGMIRMTMATSYILPSLDRTHGVMQTEAWGRSSETSLVTESIKSGPKSEEDPGTGSSCSDVVQSVTQQARVRDLARSCCVG